jgi:hypothetical protein
MPSTITTDSAKRALLDHLIDDASLFPPAGLDMRAALRAHARHRESAYAWIGGNFVVPASRLTELIAARDNDATLTLSVIMDGAQRAKGNTVIADLDRVTRGRVDGITVSGFELRPTATTIPLDAVIAAIADHAGTDTIALWYEVPYAGGWQRSPDEAIAEISAVRSAAPSHVSVGAKLRCGGLTTGTTPSTEEIAEFLVAAHTHAVPFKATAGLHHPVRGVYHGVLMHGFLNLYIAAIALHAGAIDADRLPAILAEEDARAFVVDPTHIGWNDVRVEPDAIVAARDWCVAFGSCSFDEPVNDLRELGLLL